MPNPRLAFRYAKSILDLAIEKGKLEQVYADMELLQQICKSNPDFVSLLKSPVVKSDTKKKIVEAVTNGKISEITAAFNALLISKGRESNLPEITTAFISQYKEHKDIHSVRLTTAVPLTDEVRRVITNQVKKASGYDNIELEEKVDQDIIGGFVLQVGDKLVDASIAYDLKTIARQFENNDFIYKIR
ncbi:ATP synthase F1 subunit delta [Terrimonas pollutisoli]|uniref:ATP synthase F1 subunit delta n=1 Tax=Terrimonas pollutisoli TaxID=3034147 RepID=UPI0023EBD919|nr:ATP synthase F1 subunit delta [Terrimonas sp. H1YJ31]